MEIITHLLYYLLVIDISQVTKNTISSGLLLYKAYLKIISKRIRKWIIKCIYLKDTQRSGRTCEKENLKIVVGEGGGQETSVGTIIKALALPIG